MTTKDGARKTDTPAPVTVRGADSLGAAIAAWESALHIAGHSLNTIKAFTADVRLLARYLGAGRPVGGISTKDLADFLGWMEHGRNVPCSPKTYSRRVTSVKAFFRYLREVGACEADSAALVVQRTVQSPLPEVLTEEEARRVLDAARDLGGSPAHDARPLVLLALLLDTGIKKGECAALRMEHVSADGSDPVCVFIRYSNPRQRFKERKLPLSVEWADAFRGYCAAYAPTERVFPWSPRRLEYILEDIGARAGLTKHLSFDMCRWTCAVLDSRRGMPADLVRQKLGLSRIQWREVGSKLNTLLAADAQR